MKWPFGKDLETRAASSYGDAVIAALVGRAQGKTLAIPASTGALEACSGLVGRAFSACEVGGPDSLTRVLTPGVLEMIGRSLIRVGEVVFQIDTSAGLKLLPAQSWDVEGDPDPDSWEYRLTLSGPSKTLTYDNVPSASVLHFRYAADPARPWRGNSPIAVADLAGKLSAETARALYEESSGPVGSLLGLPGVDGADATVEALKTDIANARGKVGLLEGGDWGSGGGDAKVSLKTERFGPEPPSGLVQLLSAASQEVYAACGLNASLWIGGEAAATREAWRLALFSVLAPLGRLVQSELQEKLEDTVTLSWQELRASDLSGRARAFQSLVGGGKTVEEATAIAGLMMTDD